MDNRLDNLALKQSPEPNIVHITAPKTTTGEPLAWKEVGTEEDGYLNLSLGKLTENTIAYARCWLWSPDTRNVDFTIGSDDACRIWVRDELVWDDPDWQSALADNKVGTFTLQEGWNPLLFKIQNGLRGMGLYFRVLDDDVTSSSTPPVN